MSEYTHLPKSFVTPLIVKAFGALPFKPVWTGLGFAALMMLFFVLGYPVIGTEAGTFEGDFRLVVVHILLTAYIATAYTYLLNASSQAAKDLLPVVNHAAGWQQIADRAGKHMWWALAISGLVSLWLWSYFTVLTTNGDPWDLQDFQYTTYWMRVLGPLMMWWSGGMLYALVTESRRLSRLSEFIVSLDLLDLQPYQALIRQGLTNALLLAGLASVLSLFLFEPGFEIVLFQSLIGLLIFAGTGLVLPIRGIRRKFREAKEQELEWCRAALRESKVRLKSGEPLLQSITEIVSYKTEIENIRNWPFDSPSLKRFGLYLLIPLGSMFGGAFVERGLDIFFP